MIQLPPALLERADRLCAALIDEDGMLVHAAWRYRLAGPGKACDACRLAVRSAYRSGADAADDVT